MTKLSQPVIARANDPIKYPRITVRLAQDVFAKLQGEKKSKKLSLGYIVSTALKKYFSL